MSKFDDLSKDAAAPTDGKSGGGFLQDVADGVLGLGQGLSDAVPGYSALAAKGLGMLPGMSEQGVAAAQVQNRKNAPIPHGIGQAVGGAAVGAGLAAALPAAAPIAGAAGLATELSVGGAQAALLTPIYKLGEVANQAQLKSSPLRLEQIAHTLFSTETSMDMLKAFGLNWILGLGGAGASAGLTGLENAAKNTAGKLANKQAAKLYTKTAQEMRLPVGGEVDLAALALDQKLLENAGRTQALREQAGAHMAASAEKIPVDMSYQEELSGELDKLTQGVGYNANLKAPIKYIQQQSGAMMGRELTGGELQSVAQGLKQKARAAYGTGQSQKAQLYGDAAEVIQSSLVDRLKTFDTEAGASYQAAIEDYRAYAQMQRASEKGAKAQFTGKDALTAALGAGAEALAYKAGGPEAASVVGLGLGVAGVAKFGGKNYATLLDKYAKAPPFATFLKQSGSTLKALLGPATVAQMSTSKESPLDRYDTIEHALRTSQADPDRLAQGIRQNLDFLPAHEADAITANTVNKLAEATLQLPANTGPATLSGFQTGASDREKRQFVEKWDCKFDPWKAVLSGRPELVAEAEKFCPETIHHIRMRLMEDIGRRQAEGKPLDYSTKRRLSAILGVAGVPMQDPALGAKLQQLISDKKQAETQAGQMGSARQAAAAMKNNKATLSRAQGILNQEGQ